MKSHATQILSLRNQQEAGEDLAETGRRYRFNRLSLPLVLKDMAFVSSDPGPGDRVPRFTLFGDQGDRLESTALLRVPTLLVFGSSTCPVTDNAAPGLRELHRRYGSQVRFVMVNVREAHPGATIPQPNSLDAKLTHAARLKGLHGFEFDVLSDDLDGTLHRALSPKPNSAYLVGADGVIMFRAHWANDTQALAAALESFTTGQPLQRTESRGVLKATTRMLRNIAPVLDRAGRGAWADMWIVAPPLALTAWLVKTLRRGPARMTSGQGAALTKGRGSHQ